MNVPQEEKRVMLNMWSNGGVFSGRVQVGKETRFDIQWIEWASNTTAAGPERSRGGDAYKIETGPGKPVLVGSDARGAGVSGRCAWWLVLLFLCWHCVLS
jgi:hypothetical protein